MGKNKPVKDGNEPRKKVSLKRKRFSQFDLNQINVPLDNRFKLLDENFRL